MPIQFPNFERISFDEANPLLSGMQRGQSLMQNFMQFPQELKAKILANEIAKIQAQYAEPMAQENLLGLKQQNQYNPKIWESEIGLRGAQQRGLEQQMQYNPDIWKSEIGLRGAQAGKLNKESNWYDKEATARVALEEAQAKKAAAIQDAISNTLNGKYNFNPGNQNLSSQNINKNTSSSNNSNINPQMDINNQSTQSPNMTYAQAATMSHLLGLADPKLIDVNGSTIAVTPWGNIPVAQGLTELQKNLSKKDADQIYNFEQNVVNGTIKQTTLDELSSVISSPAFENMRQHPIAGKYELLGYSIFGTEEEQKFVGRYMAETGQIIKDSARDFQGQFRIGEQALLNSMKPNISDSLDVAKGKLESLSLMNRMLTERSRITAKLMRNEGYSSVESIEKADKIIDAKKMRNEIKQMLSPGVKSLSNEELWKIYGK